jgi:GNAT superfamily N-acetyltransferase
MQPSADCTLRAITPADREFLVEIYVCSRTDAALLARLPVDERNAFLRRQSQLQDQAFGVRCGSEDHRIVQVGTVPIGRLYVERTAASIRVLDVTLLPEWRGRGFGRRLLESILAEATEARVGVVLQVVKGNRAERLYERLGFRVVHQAGLHRTMVWGTSTEPEHPARAAHGPGPAFEELCAEQFALHVGTTFLATSQTRGDQVPLLLEQVEELPAHHSSPFRKTLGFSLSFRGPSDPLLAQDSFELSHGTAGTFTLFLVPVAADAGSAHYAATIN